MKLENYNSKAREMFGKTLIDVSVSIYKGLFLLITIVPLTLLIKTILDPTTVSFSLGEFINTFNLAIWIFCLLFFALSVYLAESLRKKGLQHINETEEK